MKYLRLFFPGFLASFWTALTIITFLFTINYRVKVLKSSNLEAFLLLFFIYFLVLFLFSSLVSIFFYIVAGAGKPSALNSRYLCALLFLFSSLLSVAFAYNISYLKTLLPEKLYFLCIGIVVSLITISLLALSLIPRKSKTIFVLFSLFAFATVLILFYLRFHLKGEKTLPTPLIQLIEPPVRNVTILYAEGFSPDVLLALADRERLPNFSYLIDKGVWGRVRSFKPVDPLVVYESALAGKYPWKTGFLSSKVYAVLGKGKLEIKPRWLFFNTLERIGLISAIERKEYKVFGLKEVVKKSGGRVVEISPESSIPNVKLTQSLFPEVRAGSWQYEVLLESVSRDWEEINRALKLRKRSNLLVVRLIGMREIKRHFMKYYVKDYYPPVDPAEVETYMDVIEKYHVFYDQIIGRFLTVIEPDELFIFISPFGVEPLPPWLSVVKLFLKEEKVSGYYDEAPEGIFFMFSESTYPGRTINISVLDLAPTVYYYLGLPVEKEADGQLLSQAFKKEFITRNPIYFIYSYDSFFKK